MNDIEAGDKAKKPQWNNFNIGDCSKNKLLQINSQMKAQIEFFKHKLRDVSIGYQAVLCELRTIDHDNFIFNDDEKMLSKKQVKSVDKFIKNGEYVEYRKKLREMPVPEEKK